MVFHGTPSASVLKVAATSQLEMENEFPDSGLPDNHERIVVDTNVIVSALVFGGLPRQVIDLVARGACEMYFSPPIREEIERVLEKKFGWDRKEIETRVAFLFSWGTEIHPRNPLAVIKDDPDDDRILECAVAAHAQTIISGDKHLLRLGSFQSIAICTPRQFLSTRAQSARKQKKK